MHSNACLICKQKNNNNTNIKLKSIQSILNREDFLDKRLDHYINFNFGSIERCKLGMNCNDLIRKNNEFRQLTNDISNKLSLYVEYSDFHNVHEILQLLRGSFPAAYRQLEIEYHKHKSINE